MRKKASFPLMASLAWTRYLCSHPLVYRPSPTRTIPLHNADRRFIRTVICVAERLIGFMGKSSEPFSNVSSWQPFGNFFTNAQGLYNPSCNAGREIKRMFSSLYIFFPLYPRPCLFLLFLPCFFAGEGSRGIRST